MSAGPAANAEHVGGSRCIVAAAICTCDVSMLLLLPPPPPPLIGWWALIWRLPSNEMPPLLPPPPPPPPPLPPRCTAAWRSAIHAASCVRFGVGGAHLATRTAPTRVATVASGALGAGAATDADPPSSHTRMRRDAFFRG
jgi:hypothetical protein